jgi:membrane-bound lytic murein transglycosylase MltF
MSRHNMLWIHLVLCICMMPLLCSAATLAEVPKANHQKQRQLKLSPQPWFGDFDGMLQRRVIRVAVPHSRSLYFVDKGQERGITASAIRDFELSLNKKFKKQLKRRPLTIYAIPVTRDKLIEAVTSGKADIAAGNLTITDERKQLVDFVELQTGQVNEILVTGKDTAAPTSVEELSGQTVHVRSSSSYYESLKELNKRLVASGKPVITLTLLPDALEDEDILEMLNVGIIHRAIMDNWKAGLWKPLLPNIGVHEQLILRAGSHIGWAIRKQSPGLQHEIESFLSQPQKKNLHVQLYRQLMQKVKGLKNNAEDRELSRFNQMLTLFDKYGQRYRFDPLMLAAQGYQESRLNQNARSHVGAIGIMQVMPRTGAEMRVGNIRVTEPNIHAGAKYLDQLLERYLKDASFDDLNRALFSFAAYNAGPGNIARIRKEAAKQGFDPDIWFNNVELVAAERIGSETTTYVRNVFKYYVAYKMADERQKEKQKAKDQTR